MATSAGRRLSLITAVVLIVALAAPPLAARAAAGTISTSAQGVRGSVALLSLVTVPLNTTQATWTSGGSAQARSNGSLGVTGVLSLGASTADAGPVTGGGTATSTVAGTDLLGAISLDAITTSCTMSASTLAGGLNAVGLKLLGNPVDASTGLALNAPGLLTATLDAQTVTYNSGTGRLDWTVHGLDVALLNGGLGLVAGGNLVIAESTCSGIVRLGTVTTASRTVTPGLGATPTVTVTNTGDIAVPNTTIRVPAPPTGWTAGPATTDGGGTCTTSASYVTCTGVTVPGGGSTVVSLPVTLASSGAGAATWAPAAGQITAVSTPVPAAPATTLSVSGGGTLAVAGPAVTTGGSVTVAPMAVAAGKNGTTTVTVHNDGPSDATGASVTVPIGNRPAGVSVVTATYAGNPCSVTATTITCTGVAVTGGGDAVISIKAAATTVTPPGTTWDLVNVTTSLNGTPVSGGGRLLTVSDPDVNLDSGVALHAVTGVPGGSAATPTVTVRNVGIVPATATTITVDAPPAGYTLGTVTTTGGGSCTTSGGITCTGVTVPANGTVTVSIPVTLAPGVTAHWSAQATATSGDSTGQDSGRLVTAAPAWTLRVVPTGPAPRTVLPGTSTTMTVRITDDGPSDAVNSSFVVVPPASTGFGTLTGAAAARCVPAGANLRCTVTLGVGDPALVLDLPLDVAAQADPATPLTGGCVSLDDDAVCGAGDVTLPAIQLRTPITDRLTVVTAPATVVPGTTGDALVKLTSAQNETGLTVTVPLAQLPPGFTVASASAPTGTCTAGASDVVCTGVSLTAGAETAITVRTTLAASVVPPRTWTATGITVGDGVQQLSVNGALASAATAAYTLDATVTPPSAPIEPGRRGTVTVSVDDLGPSDATGATVGVVAPAGSTFGDPLPAGCSRRTGTRVACGFDLAAADPPVRFDLPLDVDPGTDPSRPLTGGCADLDDDGVCSAPPDRLFPDIPLATPLGQRLTVTADPGTVVPGTAGTGRLGLTSTTTETGLTVDVPLTPRPAGFAATTATVPGGTCTVGASALRCTGIDLTAGVRTDIRIGVTVASSVTPPVTWTAGGIGVSDGTDTVTVSGDLAVAGTPSAAVTFTLTGPPDGTVAPGGDADLTVVARNAGPSDATAATVTVTAPEATTFGTPLPAGCTRVSAGEVSCTVTVAAGTTAAPLVLPIVVDAGADPFTPHGGGCADLAGVRTCGAAYELRAPFDRRAGLVTGRAEPAPGTTDVATVGVTASHGPLSGLTVTVPLGQLPPGVSVTTVTAPAAAACTRDVTEVRCTGVDVPDGGTTVISLRVAATAAAAPGTAWTATGVTVRDGSTDPAVTTDAELALVGPAGYTLDVDVTGPAEAPEPGGTGTLRVVVDDLGPADAVDARLGFVAPSGARFAAPLPAYCALIAAGARVSCTITLGADAGTLGFDLPLTVDPATDPGRPLPGGCVDRDDDGVCGPGDDPLPVIEPATPFDRQVTISTAAAVVTPGESGTARVVVATDPRQTGLSVTIPLEDRPAAVTLGRATVDTGGTCTADAAAIRCTGVDVPASGSATVSVPVTVDASAAAGLTWTAGPITVTGPGGDDAEATGLLVRAGPASYALTATVTGPADDTVLPGGTAVFTATIRNDGPSTAVNVPVAVSAPAGTTFGTDLPAVCTRTSDVLLTCTATLGPPVTWDLPVRVPAGADPRTAITGGCLDLTADGACGGTGDAPLPDLRLRTPARDVLTVTADDPAITPGRSGTATVRVTASQARTGVTVRIDTAGLPAGLTLSTASCPVAGTVVTCTGIDLTAGGHTDVTLELTAAGTAAVATWTAPVTVTTGTETTSSAVAAASVGPPVAALTVAVDSPAPDTVLPGGTADLTVTLGNAGPSTLTGARVGFRAPTGTTFTEPGTAAANYCRRTTSTYVTCTVTLGVETRSFVLSLLVPADADPGEEYGDGCVDRDNDQVCGAGDETLDPVDPATPLDDEVRLYADAATVTPGTEGTARVRLDAVRPLTGLTVTVPVSLPGGLTVTGVTGPGCTTAPGRITCTGVSVDAGGNTVASITVRAAPDTAEGVRWTATGMTVRNAGGETAGADAVIATTGAPRSEISYSIVAPTTEAEPGELVPMTLTVTNAGPSYAYAYSTVVFAPQDTTFAPLPPRTDDVCDLAAGDTRMDCVVYMAPAFEEEYQFELEMDPDAEPGTTTEGGCVDANRNGRCDDGEPGFPGLTVVPTLDQALTVSADDPSFVPGTGGTATVHVTATDERTGLTVTLPTAGLPAGVTIGDVPGCRRDETGLTCTVDTDADLVLPVAVDPGAAPAVWRPAIRVTRPLQAPVVRTVAVLTVGDPRTAVTVAVTGPATGTVRPGGIAELAVTAGNDGPSDARDTTVSFRAPAGTTFLAPADAFCRLAGDTRIVCTLDLDADAEVRFVLRVQVPDTAPPGGTLGGGCADLDGDGRCTVPPEPALPVIEVGYPLGTRLTVTTEPATVVPGRTGTGTIRLTGDVTGLTVTVPVRPLPDGLTAGPVTGPAGSTCTPGDGVVTCTGVTAPGVITVPVTAASRLRAGVEWAVTGIRAATADEQVRADGVLARTGEPVAPVAFRVAGPTGTVRAGSTTSMTVTITNPGPSDAVAVRATVIAPTQATFGPLTGRVARDCERTGDTLLTCSFDLAANAPALVWVIGVEIAATASPDNPVTGGCVSANGDSDCADPVDTEGPIFAVGRPLAETATAGYEPAVITPGDTGTGTWTITSTADVAALTVSVPLDGLPEGFAVTAAEADAGTCEAGAESVVCTGISLAADTPMAVRFTVRAAASAAAGATWTAAVTAVNDDDPDDSLPTSGVLATTGDPAWTVSVSVGAPSVPRPAPGQTTVLPVTLHNDGPSDADPYRLVFVLPTGTTSGTLPSGCTAGPRAGVVTCTRTIAADDEVVLRFPLVVGTGTAPGTVLDGCFDDAGGSADVDYACGGPGDLGLPTVTVTPARVDLSIRYLNPKPAAARGGTLMLGLPYRNNGSESASDVTFRIDPPDGVTLRRADILLDAGVTAAAAGSSPSYADMVRADCVSDPDGDANAVVCTGPDAPVGVDSQLWLTLAVARSAPGGTYPVPVTISTTSPEGVVTNNTATASLTIAGTAGPTVSPTATPTREPATPPAARPPVPVPPPSGPGGYPLPRTGQDVIGLLVLSVLLVAAGVTARVAARGRRRTVIRGTGGTQPAPGTADESVTAGR